MKSNREHFALGLAAGRSQCEAYARAYPRSRRWTRQALYSRASRLAHDPAIVARLEELRGQGPGVALLNLHELEERLAEVARSEREIRAALSPSPAEESAMRAMGDGAEEVVRDFAARVAPELVAPVPLSRKRVKRVLRRRFYSPPML